LLREEEMTEIEQLQVSLQKLARHLVVERLTRIMALLQKPAHGNANLFRVGFGLNGLGRHRQSENENGKRQRKSKTRFHEKRQFFSVADSGSNSKKTGGD
jgi:hypothetical protein